MQFLLVYIKKKESFFYSDGTQKEKVSVPPLFFLFVYERGRESKPCLL